MPRAVPIPGAALSRGLVIGYLSIVALIPLAAVVFKSLDGGLDSFWNAISSPQAVAAGLKRLQVHGNEPLAEAVDADVGVPLLAGEAVAEQGDAFLPA